MRYSKEHKQQTHAEITQAASSRIREQGIDGMGVASLMQSLGLTHGGFYAHFGSKDALVVEAVASAFEQTLNSLRIYAEAAPPGQRLARFVAAYTSPTHRDASAEGCVAAALAGELSRQSVDVRDAAASGLQNLLALIGDLARHDGLQVSPPAILALVVGAVALSRIPTDPSVGNLYLEAAKRGFSAQE